MPHRNNIIDKNRAFWKPLLSGTLLCILVFIFWKSMDMKEQYNLKAKIISESDYLASDIEADLRNRIPALQRLVNEWNIHGWMSRDMFISKADSYISDIPGFQALEWVDKNCIVKWIVPFEKNKQALNLNLAFEVNRKNAMEKAKKLKKPSVTAPIDLVQGGKGFLMFFPVFYNDRFEGYILAVFRIQEWQEYGDL